MSEEKIVTDDSITATCGLVTTEEPVTIKWLTNNSVQVLFRNKQIFTIENVKPKEAQFFQELANEMYRRGFHEGSTKLMPEIMGQPI